MKNKIVLLAALALAGTAFAQVNPAQPMVTGKGNVAVRPAKVIVTNQTAPAAPAAKSDDAINLDKLVVTGSLLKHPAKAAKH